MNVRYKDNPLLNKKAFTLIELLAVIVILAIIALIAVPIVLNIINDSRESSYKRSVELYGKTVEQGIATYQIKNPNNSIVGTDYTSETLLSENNGLNVNYEGSRVECSKIDIYEDGKIYMSGCSVGGHAVDYTYGHKVVCKFIDGTYGLKGEIGSKYECRVNDNNVYNFYLLSKNDDNSVNLILDRSICSNGTLATSENRCNLSQIGNVDSQGGPVKAYEYFEEISNNWNNIPLMNYNLSKSDNTVGYGGIITTKSSDKMITKIYQSDGSISKRSNGVDDAIYTNIRVRLPEANELIKINQEYSGSQLNFLLDNPIVVYFSYLTSTSLYDANNTYNEFVVAYAGNNFITTCNHADCYKHTGIRPVITIQNNNLG